MKKIDLHIHTTASDGTFTPEEVVQEALRAGLAAVAITDHDTAVGYPRAAEEGLRCGVEVVPGIEISTKFRSAVHILGYYIDTASPALEEVLEMACVGGAKAASTWISNGCTRASARSSDGLILPRS